MKADHDPFDPKKGSAGRAAVFFYLYYFPKNRAFFNFFENFLIFFEKPIDKRRERVYNVTRLKGKAVERLRRKATGPSQEYL